MGAVRQRGAWVARAIACAIALLLLLTAAPARAQSTWNVGTTDYNTAGNWTPNTVPATAGQSAIFGTTGSTAVNVSSAVAPDSWTFTANSQGYTFTGSTVTFSKTGAGGGLIDNANSGQTITIGNNIGGSGAQVQQLGSSRLILGGNNSYSGGTTIAGGGGIQVNTNTALGTGAVSLNGGTLLAGADGLTVANTILLSNSGFNTIDSNGGTFTLSGQIKDNPLTGPGTVEFQDSGSLIGNATTILTNINTYTGGTLICSCATVQLGTLLSKASLLGDIENEGVFNIVNADTSGIKSITNDVGLTTFLNATNAGTIVIKNNSGGETDFGLSGGTDTASAANATIINDGGVLVFHASSTAASATITNQNTSLIQFDDSASAGNATITNTNNSIIVFAGNSDGGNATILNKQNSGTIFTDSSNAGHANITNESGSGVIFSANASAGNATITNSQNQSVIEFGNSSTAANATITNNFGSLTAFFDTSTAGNALIITNAGGEAQFLDNSTGGNAQFITRGTGIVDFGGGTGPNGNGKITAGSIAGSGTYYIGGGNTLIVGSNNLSSEVSGVVADFNPCGCGAAGPGSLVKVGDGKLILSGTNTYTGSTTINGGILSVNGSITSSSGVTVNAGGTLGGTGRVPSVTINGGVLAPGNSIGTININGSLTFTAASTYLVEVSSTAADRTNVTGAATLAGTVSLLPQGAPDFSKVYTILSATGGRSGTFGPLANGNPLVIAALNYTSTDVLLSFSPKLLPFAGTTVNQRSVGAALQSALIG